MDERCIASISDTLLAEDVRTAQTSAVHLQLLAIIENLLDLAGKPAFLLLSHTHSHARMSLGHSTKRVFVSYCAWSIPIQQSPSTFRHRKDARDE